MTKMLDNSEFERDDRAYNPIVSPKDASQITKIYSTGVPRYDINGGEGYYFGSELQDGRTGQHIPAMRVDDSNGLAKLDGNAKLPLANIPNIDQDKVNGLATALQDLESTKLTSKQYVTATNELSLENAKDILNRYAEYEGSIIEFLTNTQTPSKTWGYGLVLGDTNGDKHIVVINQVGQIREWDSQGYRIVSVTREELDAKGPKLIADFSVHKPSGRNAWTSSEMFEDMVFGKQYRLEYIQYGGDIESILLTYQHGSSVVSRIADWHGYTQGSREDTDLFTTISLFRDNNNYRIVGARLFTKYTVDNGVVTETKRDYSENLIIEPYRIYEL